MERERAVELIGEIVAAEIQSMKEEANRRGTTKKTYKRECNAIQALFSALTGSAATSQEIAQMLGL